MSEAFAPARRVRGHALREVLGKNGLIFFCNLDTLKANFVPFFFRGFVSNGVKVASVIVSDQQKWVTCCLLITSKSLMTPNTEVAQFVKVGQYKFFLI